MLVVDLTRYLPGAFASRELLRLGARVVRVEAPGGDPMGAPRPLGTGAPAWKGVGRLRPQARPAFARALCGRADVVLEGFRPGVAARLGVGPDDVPEAFRLLLDHRLRDGWEACRPRRPRPQLLGWAGALADTAPATPPVQVADLAAGALRAVTEVLAALVGRERSGEGARLVVSMTHGAPSS